MNNALTKINVFVNIEVLFDFKSILFALTKHLNISNNFLLDKSQNYFDSLKVNTIEEYLSNFKENQQLKEFIYNSNLFSTVKPKLYSLLQVYFIFKHFKCLELYLFSAEEKYIKILKELNLTDRLKFNSDCKTDIILIKKEEISNFLLKENENYKTYLIDYEDNLSENERIVYINKNKGNIIPQFFSENSEELKEFDSKYFFNVI